MNIEQRRLWVDDLRRIPLQEVLRTAGARSDQNDPAKWHTAQGVLSVSGTKFFNWTKDLGGGGAIDLAMHLNTCDFTAAVTWLAQCRPSAQAPPLRASSSPPDLRMPIPVIGQLNRVKGYLSKQRYLPEALLNQLQDACLLYADHNANAVFVLLGNEGFPVGAELRGTTSITWRGLATGSRKDLGYFACGPANATDVVLCESAIDAISCATLYPGRLCVSSAGARPNPAWLPLLLTRHPHIYCGFDADTTGDQMANAMIDIYPSISRLRPALHDWNDILTASV